MKTTALLAILIIFAATLHSQTRVVHGKLTSFNSFPVMNVEICSKKAGATTQSDALGQFSLVCDKNDVILVKAKTFEKVQKKVNPGTESVQINLEFINNEANRQIAAGYCYMSKADLNYGVSHLEQENNDFSYYSDIFELIRGQLSGVTVSNNEIYVRGGRNSFNPGTTMALYVVDNTPTSSLDWLQPGDIKSISVLKDSNAAIYGTRGGNGVVLIETKK